VLAIMGVRARQGLPRSGTLALATGLYGVLVGTQMLVAPHRFAGPAHVALRSSLTGLGVLALLAGIGLLGAASLNPPRRWAVPLHLLAGSATLLVAGAVAPSGSWFFVAFCAALGLGTLLVPVLPVSPRWRQGSDLFPWLMAVAFVLLGGAALLAPGAFAAAQFQVIRSVLPVCGGCFVLAGAGLLARPRALLAHSFAALMLLGWALPVHLSIGDVSGAGLFVWVSLLLGALTWLGPWLDRIDHASLRTRLTFTMAALTTGSLVLALAMVSGQHTLDDGAITAASNGHHLRDIAFGAVLLGIVSAAALGGLIARWIAVPLERLTLATRAMAAGDDSGGLPQSSITELGTLTADFAEMRRRLAEREAESGRLVGELAEAEARYRNLFAGTAEAILVINDQGRYVDVNHAACELTGYSAREITEMCVGDLSPTPERIRAGWPVVSGLHTWQGDTDLRRRDGSIIPVAALLTCVELTTGRVYVSALRDISERRALEQMQREFIAMMGHELRTPLTAINAYATLMSRRGLVDPLATSRIVAQTEQLDRLVSDLLDTYRMDTGRLSLRRQRTDLVALVRASAEEAGACGQPIRLQLPDGPAPGFWDPDRISQVLRNLLSNAMKYSPERREIDVTVETEKGGYRVSVSDRGGGIAPEALPRIFDRFYRAPGAVSSGVRGMGIGLHVCRELVQSHGGSIEVRSELGQGTTITFHLPLGEPELAGALPARVGDA
jgi:PAS domain S-box-containing protein